MNLITKRQAMQTHEYNYPLQKWNMIERILVTSSKAQAAAI
jgi:hypothetical protein